MRVCVWRASTLKKAALCLLCAGVGLVLLRFPQAAANGVSRGLAVCGQLLIPSLFPFLTLAGFLAQSGLLTAIGQRLSPATQRLFGVSSGVAGAMLVSAVGGYPAGANALATLVENGDISEEEARHALRFCTNAGPAFIIGGIGAAMLGSVKAGVLLLIAHLVAAMLIALACRTSPAASLGRRNTPRAAGTALIAAVHEATAALVAMSGFVLAASCLLSLLDALGMAPLPLPWLRALLMGFLEVSTGCIEAASIGTLAPFFLGFALGFAGLSVCGQIAARTAALQLVDRGFFAARLFHGLLGGCFSLLLFWWFPVSPASVTVVARLSSAAASPVEGLCGAVGMLTMSVLFLATLPHHQRHAQNG